MVTHAATHVQKWNKKLSRRDPSLSPIAVNLSWEVWTILSTQSMFEHRIESFQPNPSGMGPQQAADASPRAALGALRGPALLVQA